MSAAKNEEAEVIAGQTSEKYGGQYLTFLLGGEEYGIEILKVQEIKGWESTTSIPNTPTHILGVLNLRGAIVPVMDMRKRFNLDSIEYGPTTVVIVVKMIQEDMERPVGLVVDAVADVYRLSDSDVKPAPDMGCAIEAEFIRGLATVDDKMMILLEIDRLIDLQIIEKEAASAPTLKITAD